MLGLFKKNDTPAAKAESGPGFFSRLKQGLANTGNRLSGLLSGRRIDEALFEELEGTLLSADAGIDASSYLIAQLRTQARKEGLETADQLKLALRQQLLALLKPLEQPDPLMSSSRPKPCVIMLAGVNGAGKTTSIGKLAKLFQSQGLSVLLAAGDTFRAAAREQLTAWGERNGVTVIAQGGGSTHAADPAAVIFDAVQAAQARGVDVLLADTAGRLPTQLHLMDEVKKIKRVIAKADARAPHEVWLVLDANTGQNAISQLRAFDQAVGVTGIILTKLDGTAKGGVLAAIARMHPGHAGRPPALRFIGIGEGLDDLRPFNAEDFVAALLD